MAHNVNQWDDEDRLYSSGSHSDDSPVLSYRYDKYRHYAPYVQQDKMEDDRPTARGLLAKFFMFSTAMILFCVLMYIPVYSRANYHVPKVSVAGWSVDANRDTKIYVQPNNITTIYEPSNICPKTDKNKLFLLIVISSAINNFDRRKAIRQTWGSYENYLTYSKVFRIIKDRYKNFNFTFTYPNVTSKIEDLNVTANTKRIRRDLGGFSQLLPELAKALKNLEDTKVKAEFGNEKRFEDEDEPMLPEFDMNKVVSDQTDAPNYDYDYVSNIMRIPPNGYEDEQDLEKILDKLRKSKEFADIKDEIDRDADPDFKLVFILGLPSSRDKKTKESVEKEVETYNDIIQEDFIDSYNNLTLKSIMMLKWINKNCNDGVRYILKTDDDMYINLPNLVENLRNRSRDYERRVEAGYKGKEYLLIGDLISGARPVLDTHNKWYSPRYMYGGRVYPRYLSGTGYVLSSAAARALYNAALRTNYFHLEDIFITGICSLRSSPLIVPRDEPLFSYKAGYSSTVCGAHAQVTVHRVAPQDMRAILHKLLDIDEVDKCEKALQISRRMRPKVSQKKKTSKLKKVARLTT